MTGNRGPQQRLWVERAEVTAHASEVFTRNNFARDTNLSDLVAHVSTIHGKSISVEPAGDDEWETLTALWIDYPDHARIMVRTTDTRLYQTHCVLHELAHIVFNHPGCNVLNSNEAFKDYRGTNGVIRGRLLESNVGEEATGPADRHWVIEGEAEHLAHMLARSLFRPKHLADERVFG